jgi:hypothetical protein
LCDKTMGMSWSVRPRRTRLCPAEEDATVHTHFKKLD